jgi:cystathionine gamma-synthase
MRIETLAVHAGREVDPVTGAVTPPIHLSTTFARDAQGEPVDGYVYGRTDNPTRRSLERCLAVLEGGAGAAAFASGSAATLAVLLALAPGDHVVAPADAYYGTTKILREMLAPWGLAASYVDMTDPGAVERAITPRTRLVWAETPSNPTLAVTDLAAVTAIAHAAGAWAVCDNSWATPLLQQPLSLGMDAVLHSTTKYLGGHGDLTGGAVVTRADDALLAAVRRAQGVGGAVPSPFDCWLLLRGIRTLPYRVRAHCEHAARVAADRGGPPRVEVVHYPGLADDPGHAVAARQMAAGGRPLFGGMVSVQVRGGAPAALAVAARTRLFTRATSLGGPESLIEHRASVEGRESRTPPGLLRLSVGLEHPDDLVADLAQALDG